MFYNDIKAVYEAYNNGEIIFCQMVFDVDFQDHFYFEDHIGKLADKIQKNYPNIQIANDKPKGNVKAITYSNANIVSYLSRKNFRIISPIEVSNPNIIIENVYLSLLELKRYLLLIFNNFSELKIRPEQVDDKVREKVNVQNIGIRLIYSLYSQQKHIYDLHQTTFLNSNFSSINFDDNDKIRELKLIVSPSKESPDITPEKEILLAAKPGIILNNDNQEERISLASPVIIDYIERYNANPNSLGNELIKKAIENVEKNILVHFVKDKEKDDE